MHHKNQEKLVLLKVQACGWSLDAVLQLCRHKFKPKKCAMLYDCQGVLVTDATLSALSPDAHLVLR